MLIEVLRYPLINQANFRNLVHFEGLEHLEAVSYTHLDVYKRQDHMKTVCHDARLGEDCFYD